MPCTPLSAGSLRCYRRSEIAHLVVEGVQLHRDEMRWTREVGGDLCRCRKESVIPSRDGVVVCHNIGREASGISAQYFASLGNISTNYKCAVHLVV
jgi:hypothetical protein